MRTLLILNIPLRKRNQHTERLEALSPYHIAKVPHD